MSTTRSSALPLLVAASVLLGAASPALALDGYRERKGIYYGAGLGFGAGRAEIQKPETKAGLNVHGRVGGGIAENLALDFDLGFTQQLGVDNTLLTGFVGFNIYPVGDLYLRLMGGVAHASYEVGSDAGGDTGGTGLGAGAGLGYEFWANADMAVGVGVDFQHHFYDYGDFNALNFGLTFTMY